MASQWWSQFITSTAAFLQLPASRCSSMNSKHEKWRCHCLAVTNYTTSVWWQPGNVLNPKGFQEHRTISSSLKMNSQLLKSTDVMCTPSQTASTYHSWPRPRRCRSPSHRHISRRLGYTGLSRRHSWTHSSGMSSCLYGKKTNRS